MADAKPTRSASENAAEHIRKLRSELEAVRQVGHVSDSVRMHTEGVEHVLREHTQRIHTVSDAAGNILPLDVAKEYVAAQDALGQRPLHVPQTFIRQPVPRRPPPSRRDSGPFRSPSPGRRLSPSPPTRSANPHTHITFERMVPGGPRQIIHHPQRRALVIRVASAACPECHAKHAVTSVAAVMEEAHRDLNRHARATWEAQVRGDITPEQTSCAYARVREAARRLALVTEFAGRKGLDRKQWADVMIWIGDMVEKTIKTPI